MRVVIKRGAVDLALQELGCMRAVPCTGRVLHCENCRQAAERALKTAIGEVFPKAEIVVLR